MSLWEYSETWANLTQDVTAEVESAAAAYGITLDPARILAIHPNEEVKNCPDDPDNGPPPQKGLHFGWRKKVKDNLPAAGLTYLFPCGGDGGQWVIQNGGTTETTITVTLIQEGVKLTCDGSSARWPTRCPLLEKTLPPSDGVNFTLADVKKEFLDCLKKAGVAPDPHATFAHYGNHPIFSPPGITCPDGSTPPSPAGICYNCTLDAPPPRMGFSYSPPVCGNTEAWLVCNMELTKVTRYVEAVVRW